MEICRALVIASKRAGWSPAMIAATAGRTEASARAWLKGTTVMGAPAYQKLRESLPDFAALVDGKAA